MAEPVRMVVWDLDETFWKGTLSEGGIKEYVQAHHDIIVTLAGRGILSSICSKNDPDVVTEILQEKGLLDYIVFPSISWEPKGLRLAQLIETVQLRAPTIIFIDDNPNNRAEAAALIPGLQVEAETFIPHILSDPRFAGKDDRELTRLRQYKLLESRKQDEERATGGNEDFLRTCGIRVFIDYDVEANLDRAIELINRTNQLNYTKLRLPDDMDAAREDLRRQISYFDRRAGLVYVTDKYGDYGYIGFFLTIAQRSKQVEGCHNSRLIHFCLSCRTLGMQIEKWLYEHLGRPELTVVGEVLTDLSSPGRIDWVCQVDRKVGARSAPDPIAPRVVVYGGCEAQVVSGYLNAYTSRMEVYANYAANGMFRRTEDSTTLLEICDRDRDMFSAEADALGLAIDLEAVNFLASVDTPTLFVFNLSADAHWSPKIRHKTKGWRLVLGPRFGSQLMGANFVDLPEDQLVSLLSANSAYTEEQRQHIIKVASHIRENYELAPPLSDAEKLANAREIIRRVPVGSKLIFAVNHDKWRPRYPSDEVWGSPAITKYAASMRKLAAEYPYVRVVSYSQVITTLDDMRDGWHYSRETYLKFSQLLVETAKSLAPRQAPYEAWESRLVAGALG